MTLSRANAGVVIQANDKSMEMRTMPSSIVMSLSEEQRLKLHEISQRCPVHRTLMGTIAFSSMPAVAWPRARIQRPSPPRCSRSSDALTEPETSSASIVRPPVGSTLPNDA